MSRSGLAAGWLVLFVFVGFGACTGEDRVFPSGVAAAGEGGADDSGGRAALNSGEGGADAAAGSSQGGTSGSVLGTGGEGGAAENPCAAAACAANASCEVASGMAECRCPLGYADSNGDGSVCDDIDECATDNGGCDATVECKNTPGAFTCGDCPAGYTGGGAAGCKDIDECATDNGGCSTNADCTNIDGSRTCMCRSGFTGDGVTCNAIPKPSITSFTVDYSRVCKGGTVVFSAVYKNGTATIDHGVGAIASGKTATSPAIAAKTTFTLTVANDGVPSATVPVIVDTIANGTFVWTKNALNGVAPNPMVTKLKDGRVLFLGGTATKAQIFNPHDESFALLSVGNDLIYPGLAAVDDARVLIAGGFSIDTAMLFNLTTNQSASPGSMVQPGRYASGALPLSNGKFLLAGGLAYDKVNSIFRALKSSELYDPAVGANGSFSAGADLSTARWGGAVAPLPKTGRILFAGGCTANGNGTPTCTTATASGDLYDPTLGKTGTFLKAGALSMARFGTAYAALDDDRVLVAGGISGNVIQKSAELYDPNAAAPAGVYGAFAGTTGELSTPREFAIAVRLKNGNVLIAGGNSGGIDGRLNSAELYDPTKGTFSNTGNMNTDRDQHTAVPLDNGMVLVLGGYADLDPGGSKPAEGAELYCP